MAIIEIAHEWENACKKTTVCFSGHRPEKFVSNEFNEETYEYYIKSILYYKILSLIRFGYKRFITGFARGVDLWAAEIVLEFLNLYDIELIGALPMDMKRHCKKFTSNDKYILDLAIQEAKRTFCMSERPFKGCHHLRNKFMVNCSSLLVAVVLNYNSGTGQTIGYARKKNIGINIIDISLMRNGHIINSTTIEEENQLSGFEISRLFEEKMPKNLIMQEE